MRTTIPTLRLQNQVARKQFNKSLEILKKLDKESKTGLTRQGVRDKKYNEQFVKEYRIWKNKQGILPYNSNRDISAIKNKVDAKKITKKPENIIKGGTTTKSKESISSGNKSPQHLYYVFLANKRKLLEEINRTEPNDDPKRLTTSRKKRFILLKNTVGIKDENEARTLSRLPKEKLEILFSFGTDYKQITGNSISDKIVKEMEQERLKIRKLRSAYRSACKYLKKFEEHDLDTLTTREKILLGICLRKKRRIDEERGFPLTASRFDFLLKGNIDLSETKDNKSGKDNTEENENISTNTDPAKEEEHIENDENADVTIENENQDGKNEDASEDPTKDQDDQVENDVEIIEEQNEKAKNVLDNENEKE